MPTSLVCTPGPKRGDQVLCADCGRPVAFLRFAFNYKKLLREKYFQTPQGRAILEILHRRYPRDPRVLNWLLREYRRGRLVVSPQWQQHVQMLQQAEQANDPHYVEQANRLLDDPNRPDIVLWDPSNENEFGPAPVQPGIVPSIGQMMDRGVDGKGVDLMKYTYPEFLPIYDKWNSERRQRDPHAGEVVHAFPDGWTMRRVQTPDEAYIEGEEMQNCLPKFAPDIDSGRYHVFSLRDPKNAPHANVLIAPRNMGGHWEGGVVRDIRAKQNVKPSVVDPGYHQKIMDWFTHFNEKPSVLWDAAPPGKLAGTPEEYGLQYHPARNVYGTYPANFLDLDEYDQRYGGRPEDPFAREASWIFESARIDELADPRRRADLATPEGQEFLNLLKTYHSHQNDILMPFLANQFKRGRLTVKSNPYGEKHLREMPEGGESGPEDLVPGTQAHTDYNYWLRNHSPEQAWEYVKQYYPNDVEAGRPLNTQELNDMSDWLKSKHQTTKGLDLLNKNLTLDALRAKHSQYEEWLRNKRDQSSVVHRMGDGSYIKRLFSDDLGWEAAPTQMQNCIAQYTHNARNGSMLLYSIRDKNGNPHVDIQIIPKWWYNKKTGEKKSARDVSRDELADVEKDGDWQPVPQEGKVGQIQGKNNAPPVDVYHPLVKDWFQSKHFFGPNGEDWRPSWGLPQTEFNSMMQLYNPVRDHILYYHPGDYGLDNPEVSTDYNGMVRTMMAEANVDPENKRLKHLVQWAKQFGELPQLKDALQDPANLAHLQRGMEVDHTQDPQYQQWAEANPEPERPQGACPHCGSQDINENRYGDGYDMCNHCYHEWHVGAQQRGGVDPQALAAHREWTDAEARERQEARQRQLAGTWEQSPAGQAATAVNNMIDYHIGGQPERVASTHTDGWNCWCNKCGWDLGLPDDFRIAALIKEANGFNKVRNMLTKSNALTPKNAIALEAMRQQFGDHPDMAEWLHREFRKGRVSIGANPDVRGQAVDALADALAHEQTVAGRLRDYKTYMDYAHNEDYSQADRDYYRRNAEAYKTQAEEYKKYADDAWAKVNEVDPEEVAKGLQFSVPEGGANPDSWGNGKRPLSPDHLEIIKELMKKRGQRWKNATPEEKAEFEGADDVTRLRWKQLNREYREWDKQDRNERGEWPEDKAFNKLEEQNIMKAQIPELFEQAEEEALGRLGLKLGNVIHSYPDGWTLRHINTPEAANIESEMLGHCIRTYGPKIATGDSVNFSLRDPKGHAHATFEIKPKKGLRFDWDKINPQFEKLELLGMCPECGSMVDENGRCPKCGFDFGVDPVFAQYTPEQLQEFREQAGRERDTIPTRVNMPKDYQQFRKDMIARGLARPQWAGGTFYQLQGKGGTSTGLVDKYGHYFRQWNDSLPVEERAVGSTYTGAGNPVYHVNELEDYINKVDRYGFQAPNRTLDWDSIVKSLHPGAPHSVNQRAAQEPQNGEQYDPTLGQQAYEFAAANDQLFDLYRAVNAWDKPKPEQDGQNPMGRCPRCEQRYRQYPNRYEQGMVYCGYCGEEYPEDEAEWNRGGRNVERKGPAYSEYQAAAVQHLGNLMAQHPELQTLGAHGADQVVNMACSNCGGKIQPCQTCGADQPGGADHGICENCNNVAYFPWMQNGQQGQVQAKTAATHPNHPVPIPHIGQHGQDCHCLWFDGIGGDHTANVKTADKFNDYLMGREDLQTPEAQEFLGHLQQNYLTDQTDALMPWVVREWKKGRIEKPQNWGSLRYLVPNEHGGGQEYNLAPHNLQKWGEWFNSNHPSRRGVDIMQLKAPDMHNKIQEWENALRQEEREKAKGQVVKAWPDGWTIQRLTDPDILKYEGREMSNCVGGYDGQVANGTSMIYSLRDEDNVPHTTLEISPSERNCPQCQWTGTHYTPQCPQGHTTEPVPQNGNVIQIKGHANGTPKPEYKQRLKEWFTGPDFVSEGNDRRPSYESDDIDSYDELADRYEGLDGEDEDSGGYGLGEGGTNINWSNVVESMHDVGETWGSNTDDFELPIVTAGRLGQLDELDSAVAQWATDAEANFEQRFDQNWQYDPADLAEEWGYGKFEDSHDYDELSRYESCPECDGSGEVDNPDADDEDEEPTISCPECGGDGEIENPDFDSDYEDAQTYYYDNIYEDVKREAWERDPRNEWVESFDADIRNAQARQQRHGRTAKRVLHRNFETGQPCSCTFTSHLFPRTAASHSECPTCGDPMEAGYCQRCDWGPHNVAEPQKENPVDPTRDVKGPYQSKTIFPDRWSWATFHSEAPSPDESSQLWVED